MFIKEKFEKKGMIFSGSSPDNKLTEIVELKSHPWFVGVQFHPEFSSEVMSRYVEVRYKKGIIDTFNSVFKSKSSYQVILNFINIVKEIQ